MADTYDIAVIGSGPGGYIAAIRAAQLGAKTAIVESGPLGGTCLNVGCIPSKALLASADLLHRIRGAGGLGVAAGEPSFDWPAIQKRKDQVIATLRGGIKGLFQGRGVTLYAGRGKIAGAGKIEIAHAKGAARTIEATSTILAVGSVPSRIPGWPEDPQLVCTSDEALHWKKLPESLLIVGGGVIGCEFACMMHEYGVKVTVVEMMPGLLPEMDHELGAELRGGFEKRGIDVRTGVKVDSLEAGGAGVTATIAGESLAFDKVLVATGRRPNTADIGLETVGIETDRGFIRVDDRMRTPVDGYYCIGDANGRCLLAHAASAQGITAAANALGHAEEFCRTVPYAVYTFPEIAAVGITTKQAREKGVPVKVGRFPLSFLGKAMSVNETGGFVKVVSHRETGKLLGVHVIGAHATETVHAAGVLLDRQADTADLAETVFAHPTFSEALKEAGEDALGAAIHLPPRKVVQITAGG